MPDTFWKAAASAVAAQPPVWLLDVDGVVNAPRPGWHAAPQRADVWSDEDNCEYPLRWAPGLVTMIRELHRHGLVEVRWCTTWCPDAARLETLWRLPALDRALPDATLPKGPDCWPLKLTAAHHVLESGRRLVWSDDEAIPYGDLALDTAVAEGRALLLRPSSRTGLQPADMDTIEAFLRDGMSTTTLADPVETPLA